MLDFIGDDLQKKDFEIKTDSLRLQQVLLNLLSNAIKYTQEGEIKIIVALNSRNNENYIRVAVKDTGLGISKRDQKKLFKLFGTVENDKNLNKKGIGLGLCICKMISTQFGGDIYVDMLVFT